MTQTTSILQNLQVDQPEVNLYTLTNLMSSISLSIKQSFPGAIWCSAEISELKKDAKGHVYLNLIDHDAQGNRTAQVSAKLWQTQAMKVLDKFLQITASPLSKGMQVLLLINVQLHANYGLSLIVLDIDPQYTLGGFGLKLEQIKKQLIASNIIDNNKRLQVRGEYGYFAVISPQEAAGLGDFMREAKLLEKHNLCKFTYFQALFQGTNAAHSIVEVLVKLQQDPSFELFNAIIIIRGGGSSTDLAWLNDFNLAQIICLYPTPIFVGIGHERDYTILDAIACRAFDTPSKVINHILQTITHNAIQAEQNYVQIKNTITLILQNFERQLEEIYHQTIFRCANTQINTTLQNLTSKYSLVQNLAVQAITLSEHNLTKCYTAIQNSTQDKLNYVDNQLHAYLKIIYLLATQNVDTTLTHLENLWQNTKRDVADTLEKSLEHLKTLMREIILQSPEKILAKGFAIVTSPDKQQIYTTAKSAANSKVLQINFQDGHLKALQTSEN